MTSPRRVRNRFPLSAASSTAAGPDASERLPVNFASILRRSAASHAGNTAGVHDGRRMTYAELYESSSRLANGLLGLGLSPGARV